MLLLTIYTVSLTVFLIKVYLINLFLNLNSSWVFSYLFMGLLMVYFMPMILSGSVPFNFILGSSGIIMFMISFISWYLSYLGLFMHGLRFHNKSSVFTVLMYLFDNFVSLLRPVTLTLRILINVSLGHFLIMVVHLNMYPLIILVWGLEMFVYLVQMYVFMTLTKSYVEVLLVCILN